ncbi:hypothetical protein L484_006398 [Morus notabilis]|uniref:Uncharacterized protein n=1 Tax=Morus notabilis TaxID=981085 RepID=W9RDI7_9ROSA|nr:hypothetical protein L484_006398 [Morus notabilis]
MDSRLASFEIKAISTIPMLPNPLIDMCLYLTCDEDQFLLYALDIIAAVVSTVLIADEDSKN